MIHELRIYECVPGKLPDLNKRFATITLNLVGKARHQASRLLDHRDRRVQRGQTLYYIGLGSSAEREKRSGPRSALIRIG